MDPFLKSTSLAGKNFKHTCTDGAPAIIGVKSRFVTPVKNEWPRVTSSHSSLHRYTLASKTLPLHLMEVMDFAIKMINLICLNAKNHRLLELLAEEMGAQHVGLLFYTKIRCLSRGNSLKLKDVEIFLRENKTTSTSNFTMKNLLQCLRTWPMYSATSTT